MGKKTTSISTNKIGDFTLSLLLDKRSNKNTDKYPLTIRFYKCANGKEERYFYHLDEFLTEKYFEDVVSTTASRSSLFPIKKKWEATLEGYRARLAKVAEKQQLSIPLIRTILSGVDVGGEAGKSFIGIWEEVISKKRKEGFAGTAENYGWALNSFRKIIGDVEGFAVNKDVIAQWSDGMKNGIVQNGKLVGKIADATRGMYLRTCRVVWNECVKQGFLAEVEYPFSNKDNDLVTIPRGKRRQKSYLTVKEMTELYKVFAEKNYPKEWGPFYTEKAHQSLGLFLAQYLCNGFNLADAARLEYNATYWQEGGKAFEFQRKKTAARSNDNSVVIVPIIKPLKFILEEIAAKPTKGGFVFPFIFHGETDEEVRRKLTSQENSNVKDRVQRICKEVLHWDKGVTGTWARHSFATNLKLAGVEEEYIAESMGHSHGNNVTAGYQDMYPLDIRFRKNSRLLNLEDTEGNKKRNLDKLTKAEMKALLEKLLG